MFINFILRNFSMKKIKSLSLFSLCMLAVSSLSAAGVEEYSPNTSGSLAEAKAKLAKPTNATSDYSLEEVGGGGANGTGAVITKYLLNEETGEYEEVEYQVAFDSTLGNASGENKAYYKWDSENSKFELSDAGNYDADSSGFVAGYSDSDYYGNAATSVDTAAKYVTEATAEDVNASFIANTSSANGSAIYMAASSSLGTINGDFIANTSSGSAAAIYVAAYADIDVINGDFIGNTSTGTGGAIYIYRGTAISEINGDFLYNTSDDNGGAISFGTATTTYVNTIGVINGDFIGNTGLYGGAIFIADGSNTSKSAQTVITEINGDFIGNTASALGGAIMSYQTIITINGDFIENTSSGSGGAIQLQAGGVISNLNGSFIGNTASTLGGAIFLTYHSSNGSSSMGTIVGDFENNTAGTEGGAIYMATGTKITSLTGDFTNNTAGTEGGAIYNIGTITSLLGDFIGNNATGTSTSGGAIYNTGTITLSGDFIGNYASSTNAVAQGGAIYNTGTVNFNATSDIKFDGNYTVTYAGTSDTKTSNAIYNTGTLNFNAGDYSIIINDDVDGATDYSSTGLFNVNTGTVLVNGTVTNQYITVAAGATLSLGLDSSLGASLLSFTDNSTLSIAISDLEDASIDLTSVMLISYLTNVNAVLDFSSFIGEFSFDIDFTGNNTLTADTFYDFLNADLDVIFTDSTIGDIVAIEDEENNFTSYVVTSTENEILAEFEISLSGTTITISGAVPEPSTYAMIFGVLALGFAYYRKRKQK